MGIWLLDVGRGIEQRVDAWFDLTTEGAVKSTQVVSVQLVGGQRFDWVADQRFVVVTVGAQTVQDFVNIGHTASEPRLTTDGSMLGGTQSPLAVLIFFASRRGVLARPVDWRRGAQARQRPLW